MPTQTFRRAGTVLVLGILTISVFFVPVSHFVALTHGTDSFETHHALYGERVKTQTLTLRHDITGAGAILVNLSKDKPGAPVVLTVLDERGTTVSTTTIEPAQFQDDKFTVGKFEAPIPREIHQVTLAFTAPTAAREQAVGIRFDQDSRRLAVGVTEQMPLWRLIRYWRAEHGPAAQRLAHGLAAGIVSVITLIAVRALSPRHQRLIWLAGLVILAAGSVLIRLPTLERVEGVFGGDAYNYIFKAMAWVNGDDPFAADARKAPLFSLLLIPGLLTSDPIWWGRVVSLAAAAVVAVVVPLVARRLGLPRALALLAGLLVTVNRELRWEGVHGLANTLYTALILVAVLALLYSRRAAGAYLVGVFTGLATLTRYEGGLVSAVLLPAVWLYHRLRPAWIIYTLVPVVLLTLFPLILWPLTGQLGVRTAADIAADSGLSVAYSADDFFHNLKNFKQFAGRLWFFSPGIGNQGRAFLLGLVAGAGAVTLHRIFKPTFQQLQGILPAALGVIVILLVMRDSTAALEDLTLLVTGLCGLGAAVLLWQYPRYSVPVLLMLLLQIGLITAILPKGRYYLQIVPFLSLAVVAGIASLTHWQSRFSRLSAVFLAAAVSLIVYVDASDALGGIISDYNSKSEATTVMLQAARWLRATPGTVALATDDLSMRVMLTDARLRVWNVPPEGDKAPYEQQLSWLREQGANFVVEHSENPRFSVAATRPDLFETVKTFTPAGGGPVATIYRVAW